MRPLLRPKHVYIAVILKNETKWETHGNVEIFVSEYYDAEFPYFTSELKKILTPFFEQSVYILAVAYSQFFNDNIMLVESFRQVLRFKYF